MAYFLYGCLLLLTLAFLLWLRLQMVYWLGMVKISVLVFFLNVGPGTVNHFFSYKYYAGSKLLYNPHHVVYNPLCLIFVKFYKDEFYCKFFFIEMRWIHDIYFFLPLTQFAAFIILHLLNKNSTHETNSAWSTHILSAVGFGLLAFEDFSSVLTTNTDL